MIRKLTKKGAYELRRDMIATNVWEAWTKNGLGLDDEDLAQTATAAQDAVANTYVEDIGDIEWYAAALARLRDSQT